jgi:antitoxin component YwqK of YwqJK toxin-antitoxin module
MMKMTRYYYFVLFLLLLNSCQDASSTIADGPVETVTVDETAYEVTPVVGSAAKKAIKRDLLGGIAETGFILNGLKQGTWTSYGDSQAYPEKIVSYIDGALNGPYIEMDQQGRVALVANYTANVLDGPYAKYRIGRPEQTVTYVNGLMDGPLVDYDFRNGKLKKEVTYKMGVLHGPFRYFNDEGEVMQEYTYIDGERME